MCFEWTPATFRTGRVQVPHTPPLRGGGVESSSGRGFSHDAVRPNATGIQIRLRISRISSSPKQLWVGHVFFRFGASGLQELVEAEESAAEGADRLRPPDRESGG